MKSAFKINISNISIKTIILICFLCIEFGKIINSQLFSDSFISIYLLIVNILNIYLVRKNKPLLIVLLFITYANYSICLPNYLSYFSGDFFVSWTPSNISSTGLNILAVFSTFLFLLTPKIKGNDNFFFDGTCNMWISRIILISLLIILLISIPKMLVSGRGQISTIFEYSIILFIIGLYYSDKNKTIKMFYLLVGILYILIDLMSGNRATSIQLCIAFYLIFWINRFSVKQLIILLFIGLLVFSSVGVVRNNITTISIGKMINQILNNKLVFDTAYSAYFTSLTFIKTALTTSFHTKLLMFISFMIYIFSGINLFNANLPTYTRNFFVHYFGGLYPIYGYFYFGIIGVFIFLFYLILIIRKINNINVTSNGFTKCLVILVVSTVPRWYLYSPFQITRNIFLMWVFWYLIKIIDDFSKKKYL